MTKSEIYEAFDQKISKIAIVERDGNYVIQGKWSIVEPIGRAFDVWICNPTDMTKGLGTRKVNNMLEAFQSHTRTPFHRLNGEAYTRVAGKEIILQNLDLLGIRKKRQYSDETLRKTKERLKEARDAQIR